MRSLSRRLGSQRTRSQLQLIVRLAQRQVAFRYKESSLGMAWGFASPLLLLALYGVVFGVIFKNEWIRPDGTKGAYALFIFSGLMIFNLYVEVVNGATALVQNNAQLIKRTTVSLKTLPFVNIVASLFTFSMSLVSFIVMYALLEGIPPWTAVLFPVLLIPLLIVVLAMSLIIASVAAYFRDLQQLIPLANTAVLFLSPIFFAGDRLPARLGNIVRYATPLGAILPASKQLLFYGQIPRLAPLALYTAEGIVMLIVGWWIYGKASKGFADVV